MSEPLPDPRPKPRFSLPVSRERLIELGVVVFGVMIALGLDNLVQEVRLRGDARELEKAFRADIIEAVSNSWERQLVDPCQRQTLASLTERANSSEGGKPTFLRYTGRENRRRTCPRYGSPEP